MPFRRTRFRRRRRRFRRRRGGGLRRKVNLLLSRTDLEVKRIDENLPLAQPIVGAPVTTVFFTVPEGTGLQQRIGQTAKWLSWTGRFRLILAPIALPVPTTVVFFLVLDKQPNNVLVTPATVFQFGLGATGAPENDYINRDQIRRFRMLKKWTVNLDPASRSVRLVTKHKRYRISTRYNGPGAAIGAVTTNVLLLFMGSSTVALGDAALIEWTVNQRFVG